MFYLMTEEEAGRKLLNGAMLKNIIQWFNVHYSAPFFLDEGLVSTQRWHVVKRTSSPAYRL